VHLVGFTIEIYIVLSSRCLSILTSSFLIILTRYVVFILLYTTGRYLELKKKVT